MNQFLSSTMTSLLCSQLAFAGSQDPLVSKQWGLKNSGASFQLLIDHLTTLKGQGVSQEDAQALDLPSPAHRVVVAVLDSGIDSSHPDLAQIIHSKAWNFAGGANNSNVADTDGHGTHVAGIIAAQKNNFGVQGITDNVILLPIRVIPTSTGEVTITAGIADAVAKGIRHALEHNAQVINLSLGFPETLATKNFYEAIEEAHSKGVLMVAASGNDSTDQLILPCSLPQVLCVGAHSPDGAPTLFSNRGKGVDLLAPGLSILSTFPSDLMPVTFTSQPGFEMKDGSSMAAPFVSGALAHLLGHGLSAGEAKARLLAGARKTLPSKVDPSLNWRISSNFGNLDLSRSLNLSERPVIVPVQRRTKQLSWDQESTQLEAKVDLQNIWQRADGIRIETRVLTKGLSLKKSQWQFADWKSGDTKQLQLEFLIQDLFFDSEIDVLLMITSTEGLQSQLAIRMDVVVPMEKIMNAFTSKQLVDTAGRVLERNYDSILSVQTGNKDESEQMGLIKSEDGFVLELLKEGSAKVEASERLNYSFEEGLSVSVTQIFKMPSSLPSAKNQYAILLKEKPQSAGKGSGHRLIFTNQKLQLQGKPLRIPTEITYLKEDFQWLSYQGFLSPTWYSIGKVPELEKSAANPWKPDVDSKKDYRLYVLTRNGLRTLALPAGFDHVVSLLPNPSNLQTGVVKALLAKGEGYDLTYILAELKEGKWTSLKKIEGQDFHYLKGVQAPPVLSNLESQSAAAFSGSVQGPNFRGLERTSIISNGILTSFQLAPQRPFDRIRDVTAVFQVENQLSAFSLSQYEILYHDLKTGQKLSIDQKRFSFLPEILALKSYFPVLVGGKIPALYVPAGFLLSRSTQIILPIHGADGKLTELRRPARFRILPAKGCEILPKVSAAGEMKVFCGDRFHKIRL